MIIDPNKLFLQCANEEAKKLQAHRGDTDPKGIVSTQVKGLAIATAKWLMAMQIDIEKKWD